MYLLNSGPKQEEEDQLCSKMAITSKPNSSSKYQIRSISLPSRSHPSTIKLEQELTKLNTWEAAATEKKSICVDGLAGLAAVYKCTEELLDLPLTRQALSSQQHQSNYQKWVNELLDGWVKFLDVCGRIREMASEVKEQIRDVQCALRRSWRRKGSSSPPSSSSSSSSSSSCVIEISNIVSDYISFRKKIKKDAKRLMVSGSSTPPLIEEGVGAGLDQHHIMAVIRVLVTVGEATASIFESVLINFFSINWKPIKPTRWSKVSKLIQKGTSSSTCEDHGHHEVINNNVPILRKMNEFECADVALLNLCKGNELVLGDKFQIAQSRLEAMEILIESLDGGLECIFRCLIRTRASMLNILSQ